MSQDLFTEAVKFSSNINIGRAHSLDEVSGTSHPFQQPRLQLEHSAGRKCKHYPVSESELPKPDRQAISCFCSVWSLISCSLRRSFSSFPNYSMYRVRGKRSAADHKPCKSPSHLFQLQTGYFSQRLSQVWQSKMPTHKWAVEW